MKEQTLNKTRLGAFVLIASLLLVLGLYYIGSQKNIFHSSINVKADFSDIGGLMAGNNVRFNGINVGTVSKVYPISDQLIRVEFAIDENSVEFIGNDATVAIGTDGLLGNKLVNISPGTANSPRVKEGDLLVSISPVEMDDALRTLNMTNENILEITKHLRHVLEEFDQNNSLWTILNDSTLSEDVKSAVVSFKLTGENTAVLTGDIAKITGDLRNGKGAVGALLTDTLIFDQLSQTIVNIRAVSDSLAIISGDFRGLTNDIRSGKGALGTLISDTTFVHHLNQSMVNIDSASHNFNENMIALKSSWPFKKYFKRKK
jgi:phospholipid/cholesterol/gamma-HCH transport system substrate-binding protein